MKTTLFMVISLIFCMKSSTEIYETSKLSPSDRATHDLFGNSMGIYGDYSIISAQNSIDDYQKVYIFKKNYINNTWTEITQLQSTNDWSSDYYMGVSVAIYNEYIMIGVPFYERVHLFELINNSWEEIQILTPSNNTQNIDNRFGYTISMKGDYALIGTMNGDKSYIFKRNSDWNWSEMDILIPSDINETDWGYSSLSLEEEGNFAVIGARMDDEYDAFSGAVYIYKRNIDESWTEITKLTSINPGRTYFFGCSVSMYGEYIVIGEYKMYNYAKGDVYIYKINKNDDTIDLIQTLNQDDNEDWFGVNVVIYDNYLAVSSLDGTWSNGYVYLYKLNLETSIWEETNILLPSDSFSDDDCFGSPMTMHQNNIIIGRLCDYYDNGEYGNVYIYDIPLIAVDTLSPTSNEPTVSPTIQPTVTKTISTIIDSTLSGTSSSTSISSISSTMNSNIQAHPSFIILFFMLIIY